mgnify:CR=1 FL=1|jgi:hypothetical protein
MTRRSTRGRPKQPVTIPLADDLAVYARLFLRYRREPTRDVLALCVLAQRVIVEKARSYYKRRGRMDEVANVLSRINSDPEYARSLVTIQAPDCRLAVIYPKYLQAGLIE